MAYPPHSDPDPSRWQRELEHLQYVNHQLRTDLEEARMAIAQANKDAASYREEVIDLKNKIEVFWDSIENARAMCECACLTTGAWAHIHLGSCAFVSKL